MIKHPGSVVGASGQHRCAGRGADRAAGVEAVESQAVGCHRIEVRCFERRMVLVASLAPALIVRHHKDDVWLGRQHGGHRNGQRECGKESLEHRGHSAENSSH